MVICKRESQIYKDLSLQTVSRSTYIKEKIPVHKLWPQSIRSKLLIYGHQPTPFNGHFKSLHTTEHSVVDGVLEWLGKNSINSLHKERDSYELAG